MEKKTLRESKDVNDMQYVNVMQMRMCIVNEVCELIWLSRGGDACSHSSSDRGYIMGYIRL